MALDFSGKSGLAEALWESFDRHASRVALIEVDRDEEKARLTYGDVKREAERLAAVMASLGLKPDDRCVFLLPNQSKWVVTAAAVLRAGGVLVPIDAKLTPGEQASLIAFAEPALIVTDADLWRGVERELKPDFLRTPVLMVGPLPESGRGAYVPWDAPAPEGPGFPARAAKTRADIAAIIFTSGTGGDPKGCMLSHGAYMAQMESIDKIFPLTPKDRYFSIIPANHVIDFMCGFLLSLMSGATVIHQRTLRSQYLLETMRKYRITCTALVPLLLRTLRQGVLDGIERLPRPKRSFLRALIALNGFLTRRRPRFGLSRLLLKPIHDRFGGCFARFVVGGSFVDPDVADFFQGIGIGIHIGYGLTEVCTVIALNDLRPYRGDTVGRAVHNGEVQIRNAGPGGIGEVWVRAPFLMSGYFKNESMTSETIVDGWLRTGDLGSLDSSGHLQLTGRSKNVIVTEGGKKVYPEDVENAFRDLEECDEYCVFSAHYVWPQKDARCDRLILILRPKEWAFAAGDFSEKIRQANHRLDYHKRISGYLVWERPFPRTASLKVKREGLALVIRKEGPPPEHVIPV